MDIWGNDEKREKNIASEWDNHYSIKRMEILARSGFGANVQILAAGTAYEYACMRVLEKYKISLTELDEIIRGHSSSFGVK